jgi:hypothetical protein
MTDDMSTIPAGNSAFTQPVSRPDQSTGDAKVDRGNSAVISDAHYDSFTSSADRDRYARVKRPDGNGSEWRDRSTLDSAKSDNGTPPADAIDVATLRPDAKHKFVGAKGEFELTGQQLQDAIAAHAADVARKAGLPDDPSKYEFGVPKDFQVPGGIEIKFDPARPEAQDLARWAHRHGISQDAFREVLAIEATRQAREVSGLNAARQAEIDRLGATGVSRVMAVEAFLDGMGASDLKGRIFTGKDVAAFERIIQRVVSQGAAPMPQGKRDAPDAPGRLSAEQYDALPARERLSYTKQFDQKSMPPWRDPRG